MRSNTLSSFEYEGGQLVDFEANGTERGRVFSQRNKAKPAQGASGYTEVIA